MKMKVIREKKHFFPRSSSLLMEIEKRRTKLKKNSYLDKNIVISNEPSNSKQMSFFSNRTSTVSQDNIKTMSIEKKMISENTKLYMNKENDNNDDNQINNLKVNYIIHYPNFNHWKSINDSNMKKNIFLPRIIDRLKYSIPRNLRDKDGVCLHGEKLPKEVFNREKSVGLEKIIPYTIYKNNLAELRKK